MGFLVIVSLWKRMCQRFCATRRLIYVGLIKLDKLFISSSCFIRNQFYSSFYAGSLCMLQISRLFVMPAGNLSCLVGRFYRIFIFAFIPDGLTNHSFRRHYVVVKLFVRCTFVVFCFAFIEINDHVLLPIVIRKFISLRPVLALLGSNLPPWTGGPCGAGRNMSGPFTAQLHHWPIGWSVFFCRHQTDEWLR